MPRIQTKEVIAELEATKIATIELKAPIGVGVDLNTGELTKKMQVQPVGDPVLKQTIIPGKIITEGFLKATLMLQERNWETTIYLPIYSFTEIEGIEQGDQIEVVTELEHISISGLPDTVPLGHTGYKVKIFVRVLLKMQLMVTRLEIISLPEEKNSTPPKTSANQQTKPEKLVSNEKGHSNRYSNQGTWNRYWAYMHR